MLYVVLGSICAALCAGASAFFIIYLRRRMRDFADKSMSEYEDDEVVPDDVSRRIFFSGLKIAMSISLIAAVLICALIVAAWLLIYKGVLLI